VTLATPKLRLAALVGTLALALAACGGSSPSPAGGGESSAAAESMEESAAESMAPSEAASAAPSETAFNPGAAAASISDLSGYQLDITISAAGESNTISILTTTEPVAATHYTMSGSDSIEVITIDGVGSWLNQDGTWTEPEGGTDIYMSVFNFFAPDRLVSQYQLGNLAERFHDVGSEDHNGVASKHLHLDAGDVADLPSSANFPSDGMFDLWVAEDGGYLVGLTFSGTDVESGEFGEMKIEVSRVNDPSISIEPPV
jgi:hypothetical protein